MYSFPGDKETVIRTELSQSDTWSPLFIYEGSEDAIRVGAQLVSTFIPSVHFLLMHGPQHHQIVQGATCPPNTTLPHITICQTDGNLNCTTSVSSVDHFPFVASQGIPRKPSLNHASFCSLTIPHWLYSPPDTLYMSKSWPVHYIIHYISASTQCDQLMHRTWAPRAWIACSLCCVVTRAAVNSYSSAHGCTRIYTVKVAMWEIESIENHFIVQYALIIISCSTVQ